MIQKKYKNSFVTGFSAGLVLPLIVFIIIFLFSKEQSISSYIQRIIDRDVVTHIVSLSVFPNVILFLLFNRFDNLKSSRGILGITIIWALTVFLIKMI